MDDPPSTPFIVSGSQQKVNSMMSRAKSTFLNRLFPHFNIRPLISLLLLLLLTLLISFVVIDAFNSSGSSLPQSRKERAPPESANDRLLPTAESWKRMITYGVCKRNACDQTVPHSNNDCVRVRSKQREDIRQQNLARLAQMDPQEKKELMELSRSIQPPPRTPRLPVNKELQALRDEFRAYSMLSTGELTPSQTRLLRARLDKKLFDGLKAWKYSRKTSARKLEIRRISAADWKAWKYSHMENENLYYNDILRQRTREFVQREQNKLILAETVKRWYETQGKSKHDLIKKFDSEYASSGGFNFIDFIRGNDVDEAYVYFMADTRCFPKDCSAIDLDTFIKGIFYVGKGSANRMKSHVDMMKLIMENPSRINFAGCNIKKFDTMLSCHEDGHAILLVKTAIAMSHNSAYFFENLVLQVLFSFGGMTNQVLPSSKGLIMDLLSEDLKRELAYDVIKNAYTQFKAGKGQYEFPSTNVFNSILEDDESGNPEPNTFQCGDKQRSPLMTKLPYGRVVAVQPEYRELTSQTLRLHYRNNLFPPIEKGANYE